MLVPVRATTASFAVALACVALSGCAGGPVDYAGKVVNDTVTMQVPALAMPAVDLDAGFAPNPAGFAALSATARRSTVTTIAAITGLGSMSRVASVAVEPGEVVRAGQEIAWLDSAALDANVAVARAAQATAQSQVGVLDDALSTVAENRSTLASKRREVNAAEAQLTTTRATLAAQLAQAKALLAKVEALGAGSRPGGTGVPPGTVPTGTVPPGTTPPPGALPPGTLPDSAQLRDNIAKLSAALAKIDAGLGKVASGRAQLSSARANLADARIRLTDIRSLARVAADASAMGVQLAQYQRELSVIRTPFGGVIVSVVSVGDVLAPGATLAQVRTSAAPRVTTWIAPEDLGDLRPGTRATVRGDWFPAGTGAIRGAVSHISPRAEYPPTSFSTSDIHMTRAIRVEIALSPTADQPALPPGAPVDVRFLGR